MAHYDVVLDVGYDYGADGGRAWDTQIVRFPNGRSLRNERREFPLGVWQLGNRTVDAETHAYLDGFVHAMRGQAHSFLYKDWNDYRAIREQLVIDGAETTQLIKTYGLLINPYIREIRKPKVDSVVLEELQGAAWVALEAGVDYELDASTGLITWAVAPDSNAAIRWTGEYYVPARFDRDMLNAQFLGVEERRNGTKFHAYALGALGVVEEPPEDD